MTARLGAVVRRGGRQTDGVEVPPRPERPLPVELARRVGGGLDVLLLWDRHSGRVWVRVLHCGSGRSFTVDASPSKALDVFYHPFAYRLAKA